MQRDQPHNETRCAERQQQQQQTQTGDAAAADRQTDSSAAAAATAAHPPLSYSAALFKSLDGPSSAIPRSSISTPPMTPRRLSVSSRAATPQSPALAAASAAAAVSPSSRSRSQARASAADSVGSVLDHTGSFSFASHTHSPLHSAASKASSGASTPRAAGRSLTHSPAVAPQQPHQHPHPAAYSPRSASFASSGSGSHDEGGVRRVGSGASAAAAAVAAGAAAGRRDSGSFIKPPAVKEVPAPPASDASNFPALGAANGATTAALPTTAAKGAWLKAPPLVPVSKSAGSTPHSGTPQSRTPAAVTPNLQPLAPAAVTAFTLPDMTLANTRVDSQETKNGDSDAVAPVQPPQTKAAEETQTQQLDSKATEPISAPQEALCVDTSDEAECEQKVSVVVSAVTVTAADGAHSSPAAAAAAADSSAMLLLPPAPQTTLAVSDGSSPTANSVASDASSDSQKRRQRRQYARRRDEALSADNLALSLGSLEGLGADAGSQLAVPQGHLLTVDTAAINGRRSRPRSRTSEEQLSGPSSASLSVASVSATNSPAASTTTLSVPLGDRNSSRQRRARAPTNREQVAALSASVGGTPSSSPLLTARGMADRSSSTSGGRAPVQPERAERDRSHRLTAPAPYFHHSPYSGPQHYLSAPPSPLAGLIPPPMAIALPALTYPSAPIPAPVPLQTRVQSQPQPTLRSQGSPQQTPPKLEQLKMQLEYYFSADNLAKDVYLRQLMNPRGYVSVSRLLEFNRVRTLTTSALDVLTAVKASQHLKLKNAAVRSRLEWRKYVTHSGEHDEDLTDEESPETHAANLGPIVNESPAPSMMSSSSDGSSIETMMQQQQQQQQQQQFQQQQQLQPPPQLHPLQPPPQPLPHPHPHAQSILNMQYGASPLATYLPSPMAHYAHAPAPFAAPLYPFFAAPPPQAPGVAYPFPTHTQLIPVFPSGLMSGAGSPLGQQLYTIALPAGTTLASLPFAPQPMPAWPAVQQQQQQQQHYAPQHHAAQHGQPQQQPTLRVHVQQHNARGDRAHQSQGAAGNRGSKRQGRKQRDAPAAAADAAGAVSNGGDSSGSPQTGPVAATAAADPSGPARGRHASQLAVPHRAPSLTHYHSAPAATEPEPDANGEQAQPKAE